MSRCKCHYLPAWNRPCTSHWWAVAAERIEIAVLQVLDRGDRTGDIMSPGMNLLGCQAMGEALIEVLEKLDS